MSDYRFNTYTLRQAYEYLRFFEKHIANGAVLAPGATDIVLALKKHIRDLSHRAPREEVLVRDDGMDGYVIRFPLPEWVETEEQANDFFRDRYYRECVPSMYDCTGQLFTSWFTCKKWGNRWWAWHSVGVDL